MGNYWIFYFYSIAKAEDDAQRDCKLKPNLYLINE